MTDQESGHQGLTLLTLLTGLLTRPLTPAQPAWVNLKRRGSTSSPTLVDLKRQRSDNGEDGNGEMPRLVYVIPTTNMINRLEKA